MREKKLRHGVPDGAQGQLRGIGGPFALGGLALQALGAISGCASSRSAGDECYEVEYHPGEEAYPDSSFRTIRDRCRLDRVPSWDTISRGPVLTSECERAIADLLPLDETLRDPPDETARLIVKGIVRAFHTLLFYPVADDASIFGSVSDRDYCGNVYSGFLGADSFESSIPVARSLTAEGYDSGYGQMNLQLVRFILERIDELRFLDERKAPGLIAQGTGNAIEFTYHFADYQAPLDLAAIIVHEARHNAEGFPDGSDHVPCSGGDLTTEDCDDSMFGAYGAQISYYDAVIRGSLRATLSDGKGILTDGDLRWSIRTACEYYQLRVNIPDGALAETFSGSCSDLVSSASTGLPAFIREVYGLEYSALPLR